MLNEMENYARGMAEIRSYLLQWKKEHEEGRGSSEKDSPNNTLSSARFVANKAVVRVIDGLLMGYDPRVQADEMLQAVEPVPLEKALETPTQVRGRRKALEEQTRKLQLRIAAVESQLRVVQEHCKHPAQFYTGYNAEKHSTHYCPDCTEYSYHIGPPLKDE